MSSTVDTKLEPKEEVAAPLTTETKPVEKKDEAAAVSSAWLVILLPAVLLAQNLLDAHVEVPG
jgi:hypothetical protein